MKTQTLKPKFDEVNPEPVEVLVESIIEIAAAMKTIRSTRLSRRAIVTLIHEHSKVPRRDIDIVLNNLDLLETTWLKPVPK